MTEQELLTERQVHDLDVLVADLAAKPAELIPHRWELLSILTRMQLLCSAITIPAQAAE